jgi:hypothetical protein
MTISVLTVLRLKEHREHGLAEAAAVFGIRLLDEPLVELIRQVDRGRVITLHARKLARLFEVTVEPPPCQLAST